MTTGGTVTHWFGEESISFPVIDISISLAPGRNMQFRDLVLISVTWQLGGVLSSRDLAPRRLNPIILNGWPHHETCKYIDNDWKASTHILNNFQSLCVLSNIQGIHKRMVRIQKWIKNLCLTLHGQNIKKLELGQLPPLTVYVVPV